MAKWFERNKSVLPLLLIVGLAVAALSAAAMPIKQSAVSAATSFPRPPHKEVAKMARWVAHVTDWGTLATVDRESSPVGGVVSHSDGDVDLPTGRIYFYLTPMDELVQNALVRPKVSYTLTEAQLPEGCKTVDPEDPTCAKVTFLGQLVQVVEPQEQAAAKAALVARHPVMANWPARHNFMLLELQVAEVHLLDFYGGMAVMAGDEYYAAVLDTAAASA
ncbi:hypothetical protein HYH02_014462 [Chlamydomonas schloesseri]|uniref:CREG-like beta-barrel domain-containing protein n=1 Tax=Chlamydomonas schloesseri TaxID=2026947 RepID=A0A835SWF5_9CHLO|nr:hypothetical protein HYH02_014462 [Chlamydomonas schloesseri]|eukprot:KAG2428070.1 hypothetical protein HYH02_014462 [Chlamydomonas schloesseri]